MKNMLPFTSNNKKAPTNNEWNNISCKQSSSGNYVEISTPFSAKFQIQNLNFLSQVSQFSFISGDISATYCSFGLHRRNQFDFQLTSKGKSLIFAHAIDNFYENHQISWLKNYLGPNPELADLNIIPKETSTYSKSSIWPKLFQVILLMFMVIKIYPQTKCSVIPGRQ